LPPANWRRARRCRHWTLAAAEGVSKSTVQRALSILIDLGLLKPQQGKAIYVAGERP
jgi:DNA-binding GntR family transcriptional regulator